MRLVELHALHPVPTSNFNSSDVGSPKEVMIGGTVRARGSSQAWKRAVRAGLAAYGIDAANMGIRTKQVAAKAIEALVARGRDPQQATQCTAAALATIGLEIDGETAQTQYLLFVRADAAERLADLVTNHFDTLTDVVKAAEDAKKKAKADSDEGTSAGKKTKKHPAIPVITDEVSSILDTTKTVDIALFGRMIADIPTSSVSAATQFAHSFGVGAKRANDFDYYTALDELAAEDTTGAAMLGTLDFTSALHYRYANCDYDQLVANLAGDHVLARQALISFIQAFATSMPAGKSNTMNATAPPDLILAVVREHGPAWNLHAAYYEALTGTNLREKAATALDNQFEQLRTRLPQNGVIGWQWLPIGLPDAPTQDTGLVSASLPALASYIDEHADAWSATPMLAGKQ